MIYDGNINDIMKVALCDAVGCELHIDIKRKD